MFTWRNFFLSLDQLHKFAEWFAQSGIHPFRRFALKKAEQWMIERFEGSDGLAAIFPAMLNSLIALKALGYADDHPQVVRAERELKRLEHETQDSVRIEPCFSPVWDSAIVAICLHESGVPSNHPALKKACSRCSVICARAFSLPGIATPRWYSSPSNGAPWLSWFWQFKKLVGVSKASRKRNFCGIWLKS